MQQSKEKVKNITIENAGFSQRTCKCLVNSGIETLGILSGRTPSELLEIQGLGQKNLDEIVDVLARNGLELFSDEEKDRLYEEYLASCQDDDLVDDIFDDDNYCDYEFKAETTFERQSVTISREDIINQYKIRYVNENNIKKYQAVDDQKLSKAISNIDDEYLEFLYNVIIVNDIQFSIGRRQYCTFGKDSSDMVRIKVFSTLDDVDGNTLFHELGHACECCMLGDRSRFYDLLGMQDPGNRRFADVLKKEITENLTEIKAKIFDAHRGAVASEIGEDKYQSIIDSADFLKEYYKLSRSLGGLGGLLVPGFKSKRQNTPTYKMKYEKYRKMSEHVIENGLIATRERMIHSNAHKKFRNDYEPILDILSSICDMEYPLDLQMHPKNYYDKDECYQSAELWANLFSMKITGRDELLANARTFLPETYLAFEALFAKIKEFFALQRRAM